MHGLGFRVLGPVEIDDGSGPGVSSSGSRSQLVILSVLLAQRGQPVPAGTLMQVLWGDRPPRTARQTLRGLVSRLRQRIGDDLVGTADGYRLDVPPDAVDAGRFEALVAAARTAPAPQAAGLLLEALGLWRGRAFADAADLEPVAPVARSLDLERATARELLCRALISADQASEAVPQAEALVAEDALSEVGWVVMLEAYGASGRVADGLVAFRRARAALAREGLDPSPALLQAQTDLLNGTWRQQGSGG